MTPTYSRAAPWRKLAVSPGEASTSGSVVGSRAGDQAGAGAAWRGVGSAALELHIVAAGKLGHEEAVAPAIEGQQHLAGGVGQRHAGARRRPAGDAARD